jgi:Uma2 family endonuclease
MPKYRVEALEKFVIRTVYYVDAKSRKQAEHLCRSGQVAYEDKTVEEGDEEWLETVAVEKCGRRT